MSLHQLSHCTLHIAHCTTEKMKEQLEYKTRVVGKLDKAGSDGWNEKLKRLSQLDVPAMIAMCC